MSKKFIILGNEIKFSDQMERYNELRLRYQRLANDYSNQYVEVYKNENKNLDDVSNKGFQQGFQFIYKAIEVAVEELVTKYKIYTLDEDTFYNDFYSNYFTWEDDFSEINDKYFEIVLDSEQLNEYRTQRRQARGRVVGGGFGVGGALKGMATAGAMNMATGAAHMMLNGVAKTFTAIGNSSKKSKIFNDPNTLSTLKNGVFRSIWRMHLAIIDAVEHYKGDDIFDYVVEHESKEAEMIFTNLSKGRIPKEDIGPLIVDIFTRNPYPEKYYLYILKRYGDEGGGLSKMAHFFGVRLDDHKKAMLDEQLIDLDTINTVKEADAYLEKLTAFASTIGIKNTEKQLVKYYKHREKLDIQERTVDGILFETYEEVELAKNDLNKVNSILKAHPINEEISAIEALEQLKTSTWHTEIPNKYIKQIEKIIQQFDLDARTVEGNEYATREEAEEIRQSLKQVEALKAAANLDTLDGIEAAIVATEGITIPEDILKKYQSFLYDKKETLEKQLRTFNGIEYETIELAKEAAATYKAQVSKEIDTINTIVGDINSISKKQLKKKLEEVNLQQFETTEAKQEIEKISNKISNKKESTVKEYSNPSGNPVKKSKGKTIGIIVAIVAVLFIGFVAILGSGSNEGASSNNKEPVNSEAKAVDEIEETTNTETIETEQSSVAEEPQQEPVTPELETTNNDVSGLDTIPYYGATNTVESARDQISYLIYYYLDCYVNGNTESLGYFVYPSSAFYSEQYNYMESLLSRGIYLDLIDYTIDDMVQVSDYRFEVVTREFYTIDNPEKGLSDTSQVVRYSIELINGEFYITRMSLI